MPSLFNLIRSRRTLLRVGLSLLLALPGLYWFIKVGFTDPATRLSRELRNHAKRALIVRTPYTFVHHPINQWTFPIKDFHLKMSRDGQIRISPGGEDEEGYVTEVREPTSIAGNFEYAHIGTSVEIELIPIGKTAEVASVRPLP